MGATKWTKRDDQLLARGIVKNHSAKKLHETLFNNRSSAVRNRIGLVKKRLQKNGSVFSGVLVSLTFV